MFTQLSLFRDKQMIIIKQQKSLINNHNNNYRSAEISHIEMKRLEENFKLKTGLILSIRLQTNTQNFT